MHVDHAPAAATFLEELDLFASTVTGLDDDSLVAASHCRGWTVGDVVVHVHLGLQEMLLGLVSVVESAPDTDAGSYWRASLPTNDEAADRLDNVRFVRLLAAAYRRPSGLVRHLLPTVDGVRSAVRALPSGAVRFQGHVLSTGDFLATWAVELAIHQLDLARELTPAPPTAGSLRLTRATVEALAGFALPASWDDRTVALLGAGRIRPDAAQSELIEARLPVLG
ncbi:maleylpyruvate isomerase N-terminal domain-containing protein [Actinoplanes sp. NPDC051411]|uniref:maleylpyruvate isomerase N-terminal domain-containing protein n=1 Tax=Actinoplanes sp. NPDC051411 TaxID=3155522 RepID=UPI003420162D